MYVPVLISQLPNFPNSAEPDGLRSFGKLGSMYLYSFPDFPNGAGPSGLGSFRKLGSMYLY